jgi:uncharacterized protein
MLVDTIKTDLTQSMKAGDKQKVSCLRMLLSAFKYKQVEAHKELDDQEALSVIRTQIKQVIDSLEQYQKGAVPERRQGRSGQRGAGESRHPEILSPPGAAR